MDFNELNGLRISKNKLRLQSFRCDIELKDLVKVILVFGGFDESLQICACQKIFFQ
jgi:hypothetical protein